MSVSLFPKKITTASMGFTTRQLEVVAEENQPKAVPVLRVWGIISSKSAGHSQFGTFLKFTGEIAAQNLINGEEARSQALILPSCAETVVTSLFDQAAKDDSTAQIALEVTVSFNNSAKGGTKFAYGVKPLIDYKGEDALAEMAKKLPAPKFLTAVPEIKKNSKK